MLCLLLDVNPLFRQSQRAPSYALNLVPDTMNALAIVGLTPLYSLVNPFVLSCLNTSNAPRFCIGSFDDVGICCPWTPALIQSNGKVSAQADAPAQPPENGIANVDDHEDP